MLLTMNVRRDLYRGQGRPSGPHQLPPAATAAAATTAAAAAPHDSRLHLASPELLHERLDIARSHTLDVVLRGASRIGAAEGSLRSARTLINVLTRAELLHAACVWV